MFSMLQNFAHKAEIRESKDEIFIGEMIYLLSLQGWPCIGFTRKIMGVEVTATGADLQNPRQQPPRAAPVLLDDPDQAVAAVHGEVDPGRGAGVLVPGDEQGEQRERSGLLEVDHPGELPRPRPAATGSRWSAT